MPSRFTVQAKGKCKVLWNSCPWTWIIFVLLDIRNFQSGTMVRQTRAYTMLCRRRLLWCYKSNRTTLGCSRLLRTWLSGKNGIYCAPRGQDHGCSVTRLMGKLDNCSQRCRLNGKCSRGLQLAIRIPVPWFLGRRAEPDVYCSRFSLSMALNMHAQPIQASISLCVRCWIPLSKVCMASFSHRLASNRKIAITKRTLGSFCMCYIWSLETPFGLISTNPVVFLIYLDWLVMPNLGQINFVKIRFFNTL